MILPETVLHDLRYGIRILSRNAGSSAIMVLALAVGIGVNTAAFTAYKAMVARPLDARDPGGLVNIALSRESGTGDFYFSYPDYEAYRDAAHSFSGLIAFRPTRVTLSNAGGMISQRNSRAESALGKWGLAPPGTSNAEFANVYFVSKNYFQVLGASAVQGRTLESIPGADSSASPPVLISENYWQRRFAGDPAIVGKTIHLNGLAVTIVGITPRDFTGTHIAVPTFWLPVSSEPLIQANGQWLRERENRVYRLIGRLAPGVSIDQAQAEMSVITDQLRALHDPQSEAAKPATVLVWPGSIFPLPLKMYGGLQLAVGLILAAAAMVLAVACANVGSLQLARARSRQNELRTRLSLGATRLRVIRQLLTENAVLGLLAGGLALLFTWALLKVFVVLFTAAFPLEVGALIFDITPDLEIFAFVFGISVMAGIVSQLAPAMESSRWALAAAARAVTAPARSRRLQDFLMAAQVALSLVLLIAGSLLLRSAVRAVTMERGYDSKHVVQLDMQFPVASSYTAARKEALVGELRARLAALPGVSQVTSARPPSVFAFRTAAVTLNRESLATDAASSSTDETDSAVRGSNSSPGEANPSPDRETSAADGEQPAGAAVDGQESARRNVQSILHYAYVEPNYFETLSIPQLLGRSFEPHAGEREHSVVLSESAANQLWPGENPIGRRLRLGPVDERFHRAEELVADGPAYQVIGVVGDTRGIEFDDSDTKKIYLRLPENSLLARPILIRAQSDAAQVLRAIDALIDSIDADWLAASTTLEEMLRQQPLFILASMAAAVASTLGLLGLFLASLGIYGTVSYIVALRTREVGIRMAIGAQKRHILALILRESTRPVLAGLLAGMSLAVGASYLLRSLLYGLPTVDAISFGGVSLFFLAIALLAAYPPARRAMRVDPMVALRYE